MERAARAGGVPFEAIAGTPAARYGARVTFRAQRGCEEALARALGTTRHPWGTPDWMGVRVHPDGRVHCKPYHGVVKVDDRFTTVAPFTGTLYPVMASLDNGVTELYLRQSHATEWDAFLTRALAPLTTRSPFSCAPRPHHAPGSFCVSLRWREERIDAISVFADDRSLPADREIAEAWIAGLDATDRDAYEAALGGVRSIGPRPRHGWHAMLAWTLEADGTHHRAASLRVPRL
jgi:hypothetical protein